MHRVFYHTNRNETEKIRKALETYCLADFWNVTLVDVPRNRSSTVDSLELPTSYEFVSHGEDGSLPVGALVMNGDLDVCLEQSQAYKKAPSPASSALCRTILGTPDTATRRITNSHFPNVLCEETHPTSQELLGPAWKASSVPANSSPHQICVSLAPSLFGLTCL